MSFSIQHFSVNNENLEFDDLQQAVDHCGKIVQQVLVSNDYLAYYTLLGYHFPIIIGCNLSYHNQLSDIKFNQYSMLWYFNQYTPYEIMQHNGILPSTLQYAEFFMDQINVKGIQMYSKLKIWVKYCITNSDQYDELLLTKCGQIYDLQKQLYYKYAIRKEFPSWMDSFKVLRDMKKNSNGSGDAIDCQLFVQAINNPVDEANAIHGFKAFRRVNGELKCLHYVFDQYAPNIETYVFPCESGFHFCKNKFDVEYHYNLDDPEVELYRVKAWGVVIDKTSKTVCSHLQILDQVSLPLRLELL